MRVFLGFVLGWFGVSEILDPKYWTGYVPNMVAKFSLLDIIFLVQIHGVILAILSLALFFHFYIRFTSMAVLLVLLSIIGGLLITNGFDEIVVRDIGLFGLALAIWLQSFKA